MYSGLAAWFAVLLGSSLLGGTLFAQGFAERAEDTERSSRFLLPADQRAEPNRQRQGDRASRYVARRDVGRRDVARRSVPFESAVPESPILSAQTGLIYGTEAISQEAMASSASFLSAPKPRYCGPAVSITNRTAVCPRCGVDELGKCCCSNGNWREQRPIAFQEYGQGEYIGPHRRHHVTRYRLRVDDQATLVYRLTRELNPNEYKFNIGDTMLVEGDTLTGTGGGTGEDDDRTDNGFSRNLVILPDGNVTLPLIGQVRAAGRTVQQLRNEIQERSKKWYKFALWTVTPVQVNTRLEDLRNAVDARAGNGGQSIILTVSPDGTIQPPALGPVCVQGLTLEEAKFEIDQRYAQAGFRGIEVTPILTQRAPTFVYVLGEVIQPGRYTLERPTTVMGAIALAQGWDTGGDLRQIVVFRRADDWRLVATKLNLAGALYGEQPTPADEIFLRDSDIVLIPKRPIQRVDDIIDLVFTQGLNPLIPFGSSVGALDLNFVQ